MFQAAGWRDNWFTAAGGTPERIKSIRDWAEGKNHGGKIPDKMSDDMHLSVAEEMFKDFEYLSGAGLLQDPMAPGQRKNHFRRG